MEPGSINIINGPHDGSTMNEPSEPVNLVTVLAGDQKHESSTETVKVDKVDSNNNEKVNAFGDINMEASISADDFMRAGGFGARDDISSFLPVASDSTDFEASLRDARDYEEPQKDISRPGLGWKDTTE